MLNNFLWTFAKFKTRNFAFSLEFERQGLNLVLGRDLGKEGGWEQNTWSGLLTASCIPYSTSRPHLSSHHFPMSGPALGSETRVSLSGFIPAVTWAPPPPWGMKENESWCSQLGASSSFSQNSLSHLLLQPDLLHKSEEINVHWDRNKMQSVHRNYHCKTFTRV